MTADVAVKEQRQSRDIVTILVELEAAPAAEVCEDLKAEAIIVSSSTLPTRPQPL